MKLRAINLPSQITYGRPEGQRANAFHRRKRMPFADFRSSPDVSGLCSARESKHAAQASALPLAHGDSSSNAQPQVVLAEASLPRAALKARQVQGRGEERPAGALRASSGSGDSRGPSQEPGQASSKPFAAGGPGWLEEASTPLGSASEAGSPTFTTSADGGSRFPQQQPRPAQQASTAVPTDRPFAAGPGGTWLEVASTPLGRPGAADPTPPTVPHTVAAQRPTVVRAEAYAKPAKRRGFTIGWLDFSGPDLSGLGPRGATYEILRRPGKKKVVQTAQEFKEEGSALLEGVVEDPARIVTSLEPTERPYAANSGPSNWLEAASKPIGRQPGAGEVGRIGVSQGTPAAVPSRSPGSLEGTARTISSTEASKRPFAAGDTIGWREAASTPQGGPSRTSPTEYLGKPFAAGDNVPSWLEAASTPLGGYKAPEGGVTFTSTPRSAPHQGKVTARPGSLSTVTPRLVGSTGERAAEAISRTEPALRPFAAGPGSGNWLEAASTPIGARRIPIDSIKSAYRPAPQPSGILAVRPGSAAKVASKNPVSGEVAAKAISSTEPSRRPYAAGPGGGWLETASRPLGAGPSRPAAPGSTVKPFAAGFDTPGWLEAASTPLGGPKAPDGGATFTVDPRTIVPTQQQGKSTSRPGSRATVTSKGAATGERAAEAISRTEASKRPFAAGPGGWLDAVSTKLGAQTAPVDGKTAPRPVSSQQTGPGVAPVSFATVTDRRPSGGEGAAKAASSADPSKRPYAAGQGGGWLDAASKPLGRPGRVLPTEFLGKPFAAGDSVPGWLEAASTPLGSYSPPAGGATFELPRPQQTTAKPVSRPGSRATVTPKKFGTWGNAGEAAVQAEPTQRPFAADLSSSTVRSPAAATKPAKPFAAGPDTPGWREAASKPL